MQHNMFVSNNIHRYNPYCLGESRLHTPVLIGWTSSNIKTHQKQYLDNQICVYVDDTEECYSLKYILC